MRSSRSICGHSNDDTLSHVGALCKRIRESRGVGAVRITAKCGVPYESNITRNFEKLGMTNDQTFDRYVQALQSKDLIDPPLLDRHAAILRALWRDRKDLKRLQHELAAISFDHIMPQQRGHKLAGLVADLEQLQQPAFIMDDLWFIHALNRSLLDLFGIDPDCSPFLRRWDGWHAIASKFRADSPVRRAHVNTDEVLAPTIVCFLENRRTYPLLFTLQMRQLVRKIIDLSEQQGGEFQIWWRQATSFYLPYHLSSMARTIMYQGQPIRVEPSIRSSREAEIGGGYSARYTLVVWNPSGSDAYEAFTRICGSANSRTIFYAADFDSRREFHVNDWPEVRAAFEQWMRQ